MIPAIPPKYRFPIYAFVAGVSIFSIIVCLLTSARMNDIIKNSKTTDVGGFRDDSEAGSDEKRAQSTQILVLILGAPFLMLLPLTIINLLSAFSKGPL